MRIYKYWAVQTGVYDSVEVKFRGGSNVSMGEAMERAIARQALYERMRDDGDFRYERSQKEPEADYEVEVQEDVVKYIDDNNIVTRNRVGCLVLNTTDVCIIDIDKPARRRVFFSMGGVGGFFGRMFGSLFGGTSEERKRDEASNGPLNFQEAVVSRLRSTVYMGLSFRVYQTRNGARVFASGRPIPPKSEFTQYMFRDLHADKMYEMLCEKQNCFRARLTPKPSRINVPKLGRMSFPYSVQDRAALDSWLAVYEAKCADYATCRLVAEIGKPFTSSIIQYHDAICRCNEHLPLA